MNKLNLIRKLTAPKNFCSLQSLRYFSQNNNDLKTPQETLQYIEDRLENLKTQVNFNDDFRYIKARMHSDPTVIRNFELLNTEAITVEMPKIGLEDFNQEDLKIDIEEIESLDLSDNTNKKSKQNPSLLFMDPESEPQIQAYIDAEQRYEANKQKVGVAVHAMGLPAVATFAYWGDFTKTAGVAVAMVLARFSGENYCGYQLKKEVEHVGVQEVATLVMVRKNLALAYAVLKKIENERVEQSEHQQRMGGSNNQSDASDGKDQGK